VLILLYCEGLEFELVVLSEVVLLVVREVVLLICDVECRIVVFTELASDEELDVCEGLEVLEAAGGDSLTLYVNISLAQEHDKL
jgi:hypothetical protein